MAGRREEKRKLAEAILTLMRETFAEGWGNVHSDDTLTDGRTMRRAVEEYFGVAQRRKVKSSGRRL